MRSGSAPSRDADPARMLPLFFDPEDHLRQRIGALPLLEEVQQALPLPGLDDRPGNGLQDATESEDADALAWGKLQLGVPDIEGGTDFRAAAGSFSLHACDLQVLECHYAPLPAAVVGAG